MNFKKKIKLEEATILLIITIKILELQNPNSINGKGVLASFSPDQKFLEPSLQEHNAAQRRSSSSSATSLLLYLDLIKPNSHW